MMLVETVELQCPFCGEIISVLVDCSLGDQSYVEDCSVCCQPMLLSIHMDEDGIPSVEALPENM
jgi:transcription elongation factor Elf1